MTFYKFEVLQKAFSSISPLDCQTKFIIGRKEDFLANYKEEKIQCAFFRRVKLHQTLPTHDFFTAPQIIFPTNKVSGYHYIEQNISFGSITHTHSCASSPGEGGFFVSPWNGESKSTCV
jgi:hypothetical protein